MSLQNIFLTTLIIFSLPIKAGWYESAKNFINERKKPILTISALATCYAGWKLLKSNKPKQIEAKPFPELPWPVPTLASSNKEEKEFSEILERLYDDILEYEKTKKLEESKNIIIKEKNHEQGISEGKQEKEELNTQLNSKESSPQMGILDSKNSDNQLDRRVEVNNVVVEAPINNLESSNLGLSIGNFEKIEHDYKKIEISEIVKFYDAIKNRSIIDLSNYLAIDISHYDLKGPMLFEQIVLEAFNLINQKIIFYEKCLVTFVTQKDIFESLDTKLKEIKTIINQTYKMGPWVVGREIVRDLLSDKDVSLYKKDWREHWKSIVCIVWYLHEIALSKKQIFIEGTFNIESKKIFDFITSYEHKYDRSGNLQSSHYHEILKPKYGINVPKAERSLWSLPNNKFHILIGDIVGQFMPNDRFIFMLKPENHPTKNPEPKEKEFNQQYEFNLDILHHGGEYITAQIRKMVGSNEQGHMRKEHLPAEIYVTFEKLYYSHFPPKSDFKARAFSVLLNNNVARKLYDSRLQCLKDVQKYGIKAVKHHMKELKGMSSEQQKIRKELNDLINIYDHNELRKGREVIITADEIEANLKQI